jgi:hypothetical protein
MGPHNEAILAPYTVNYSQKMLNFDRYLGKGAIKTSNFCFKILFDKINIFVYVARWAIKLLAV